MILFKEDWARFPNAIADTKTTNESFLKYVYTLKQMGIGNCEWPLALYQPELQGIDPFAKDLSNEVKFKIIQECKWNPWYFFREIARFPGKSGSKPIPYKANRGNMALTWSFLNHIDFALVMIRQAGKSGSTDQIHSYITHVAGISSATQIITKDNSLRKSNIERIKAIRDQLPEYLQLWDRNDADNTMEITCNALQNRINTAVAQKSEDLADNMGRGLTSQILHFDEGPYISNVHISMGVALASATAVRDIAASVGGFYGNIFTTTAGKKDTEEGKYFYNLIHNGWYWNEKIFDCRNIEEARALIKANCTGNRILINGTFSHSQIGKSDEWLREAIINAAGDTDRDGAERDFLNKWSSGSEKSPLSQQLNTLIRESQTDPLFIETSGDAYQLRWYYDPDLIEAKMTSTHHIIGLDTSQSIGVDNNGMTIINSITGETVAASGISEANILRYARWVSGLLIRYPNTTLVIENKASGQSILDIIALDLIAAGEDPFARMFNRVIGETSGKLGTAYRQLMASGGCSESLYMEFKSYFGFMTTGSSRLALYSTIFQQTAKSVGHLTRDKQLIDEILALVVKNGRVDHPSGGHDDNVVAWLLAMWFLREGRSLDYYHLNPMSVLSAVSDLGATVSEGEKLKMAQRALLRGQISELKEQYAKTKNFIERTKLEKRLKILTDKTLVDGGEPVSIDQLLTDSREKTAKGRSFRERLDAFRNRMHSA